jgi:hypothetical protein
MRTGRVLVLLLLVMVRSVIGGGTRTGVGAVSVSMTVL